MGNQGDRQLGNQEAIQLKLDESPEQLDAPDQAISGNQWQSVAISGNEWPSVAIIGNHRLPNSTMLLSPLAKPRGPTICERPAVGDLPWPGEPISTLPPRHISKVGTLRHEKMRRAIRGHRRSSEVIRGHQRSSVVIRGHRRQSHLSRKQAPSWHMCCLSISANQRPSIQQSERSTEWQSIGISRNQSQSVAPGPQGARNQSQSVAISRNQSHLVHEALVQWGALDETRRLGRPVGVMTLVHLMTQRQLELDQSSIRAPSEAIRHRVAEGSTCRPCLATRRHERVGRQGSPGMAAAGRAGSPLRPCPRVHGSFDKRASAPPLRPSESQSS